MHFYNNHLSIPTSRFLSIIKDTLRYGSSNRIGGYLFCFLINLLTIQAPKALFVQPDF